VLDLVTTDSTNLTVPEKLFELWEVQL